MTIFSKYVSLWTRTSFWKRFARESNCAVIASFLSPSRPLLCLLGRSIGRCDEMRIEAVQNGRNCANTDFFSAVEYRYRLSGNVIICARSDDRYPECYLFCPRET